MSIILNQGINSCTTLDWLVASANMRLTACDPSFYFQAEVNLIEPGQAVSLPAAERARMNSARPGVHTQQEPV